MAVKDFALNRQDQRVKCKIHKTSGCGEIELCWSDDFRNIVLDYLSRKGAKKYDEPFANIDWPKIAKVFWKLVNDPALLHETKGIDVVYGG